MIRGWKNQVTKKPSVSSIVSGFCSTEPLALSTLHLMKYEEPLSLSFSLSLLVLRLKTTFSFAPFTNLGNLMMGSTEKQSYAL